MTLPFDFTTSLWLTSVPVWEWEPLPEPTEDGANTACDWGATTSAGASAEGPANFDAMHGTASSAASERPGYRLMFKGYEIAGQVFWYPADSPLARPWATAHVHTDTDHRPRRRDEPEPLPPPGAGAIDPGLRQDEKDGAA